MEPLPRSTGLKGNQSKGADRNAILFFRNLLRHCWLSSSHKGAENMDAITSSNGDGAPSD